ncbi:MAG: hypothetical protein MUD12_10630 [Spirochaetes bacterium]|jgi:hypothetical protein|nr:hypothetical protein [Spirochaetota bacterium]
MKKSFIAAMITGIFFVPAFAGNDCQKSLPGKWYFDMGGGFIVTVEYRGDGTFIQKMTSVTMKGTYAVKDGGFETTIDGQKADYTIVSCENNKMTVRRNRDGRIMEYIK